MLPFSNIGQHQPEGLTVIGEATRTTQPDVVELSLDVHTAAPMAAQALRDNAAKVMQIGQAVTSMGVSQQELQAGAATLYPVYQPIGSPFGPAQLPAPSFAGVPAPSGIGEGPMLAGFHVVSFLRLSLSDVSKLGEVVDTATRVGANVGNGCLFRLRDEQTLRRTLVAEAGRDAKEKADALASELGKAVGDPVSVTEDFAASQYGPAYQDGGPFTLTPMGTISRLPFSPGELSFHARVSVTFRLQ